MILKPFGLSKSETIEWIKSGAMQSANYSQLQEAYGMLFGSSNLRLNKTQLRSELLEVTSEEEDK